MGIKSAACFPLVLGAYYRSSWNVSRRLNMVPSSARSMAWLPGSHAGRSPIGQPLAVLSIAGVLTGIPTRADLRFAAAIGWHAPALNAVRDHCIKCSSGDGSGAPWPVLLAIPITATLRVVCDHMRTCKPIAAAPVPKGAV